MSQLTGAEAYRSAVDSLVQAGCSRAEAELRAGRALSAHVRLVGSVPAELQAKARREGLEVWQAATETHIAGSVLQLRSWLNRWPQAADSGIAAAIAAELGGGWRYEAPVTWSRGVPPGWGQRPVIMGILNVTPDSFSDGGSYSDLQKAVERGRTMVDEGAGIIDVGGESTRPGAAPVSAAEEAERVVPVIRELSKHIAVPISIDTYKPEVAEAALAAGAAIINDIKGLRDPEMVALAARTGVPVIVMHIQGEPRTMQRQPTYREVVVEVMDWLAAACARARAGGVQGSQIILDPGIGFGKTTAHNLELLRRLADLRVYGYPVLVGASRKSVIGNVLGLPVDQRLEGTAATVAAAVYARADIIRVHDVQAMRRVLDMTVAMLYGP